MQSRCVYVLIFCVICINNAIALIFCVYVDDLRERLSTIFCESVICCRNYRHTLLILPCARNPERAYIVAAVAVARSRQCRPDTQAVRADGSWLARVSEN